ncbi:secreted protein with bacterial Ig-like domain [Acrasis kona]|uniref:Secreted protein with bacterial Ig-like domain n=1 Tax=Acrasis kona TaxID=1008807 RepID=A0AAW2YK09_9EUKA
MGNQSSAITAKPNSVVIGDETSSVLKLSAQTEYNQMNLDSQELYLMASIDAPSMKVERAPIDITCVIDISGSMSGSKLLLVIKTLKFMIDQFSSEDKLSIVTFNHETEVVANPTVMTSANKESIKNRIDRLFATNGTNLCEGLLKGISTLSKTTTSDIKSVLLFTDGEATDGITDTDKIVSAAKKAIKKSFKKNNTVNVFTFGFGEDHSGTVLNTIAKENNGQYYYIKGVDEIASAFSDCLGGLLSVAAQNLKLMVEPCDGVSIKAILTSYNKISDNEVRIGDIYAEEHKDVVLEVVIDKATEMSAQPIVDFSLSYYDVISKQLSSTEVMVTIDRVKDADCKQVNSEVVKQKLRVKTVEALDQSRTCADAGNISEALSILEIAKKELCANNNGEEYYSNVTDKLQETMNNMNTVEEYSSRGNKMMCTMWTEESYQRSCDPVNSQYSTGEKRKAFGKFKIF